MAVVLGGVALVLQANAKVPVFCVIDQAGKGGLRIKAGQASPYQRGFRIDECGDLAVANHPELEV